VCIGVQQQICKRHGQLTIRALIATDSSLCDVSRPPPTYRSQSWHVFRKVNVGFWVSFVFFFFSSRRRHTRLVSDWSSDVCSSDLRRSAGAAATNSQQPAMHRIPPETTEKRRLVSDARAPASRLPTAVALATW